MSLHVFGVILTCHGAAANNRGETEGNVTTLQKLVWNGSVHTTVSAEAIRFALRRRLAEAEECNRTFDEDTRSNDWKDEKFSAWSGGKGKARIDDDLLGFMSAEAAKEERGKGKATVRRSVLEVTRAVSLTPWPGDVTFNAASPGATPSAQKKGTNPVPYGTEMHATRYQYGFALTPERLRERSRAVTALRALCNLGPVAGNHGRFLYDFSPESVVLRITEDPAPRILYVFEAAEDGRVGADALVVKVRSGDVSADDLIIGGPLAAALRSAGGLDGSQLEDGVRKAFDTACKRLEGRLL